MVYVPKLSPGKDPERLHDWVREEFEELQKQLNLFDFFRLKDSTVEIAKPRDGMLIYASVPTGGWDPGSGQGFYGFYNSQWNKIG